MVITIAGVEYPLAATLRVAYKIQGQHNHKPYSDVFSGVGKMPLEQQINILYAAFQVANPEASQTINQQKFLDYCLDNMKLKAMLEMIGELIKGIMGAEEGWACTSCGSIVVSKYCPDCGALNPEFVEPVEQAEAAQGN